MSQAAVAAGSRARPPRLADPEQLAAAPLEAIRAAKVGYRDRYIKGVAEAVAGASTRRRSSSCPARKPGAS